MTHPHYIDREAVARLIDPISWEALDVYGPEKAAFIGLTTDKSLEKTDAILALIATPMEAVAWREKALADVIALRKDHPGQTDRFYAEEAVAICRQALAVIPTEGLGSSLRDTHRAEDRAVVVEKEPDQ